MGRSVKMVISLHERKFLWLAYGTARTHLPLAGLSYATLGTRQVQVNGILCLVVMGHIL